MGVKLARVPDIDINPADAEVPTPLMLAKIGMTTNIIDRAKTANSGTMMRLRFSETAAAPPIFCPPNHAARLKNRTSVPMARPIPYIGEKLARVPDMDMRPAEAEVPTPDIEAKMGMTTNIIESARTAKRGTMMRLRFSETAAAPFSLTSFLCSFLGA
jgi:hypothetical protein